MFCHILHLTRYYEKVGDGYEQRSNSFGNYIYFNFNYFEINIKNDASQEIGVASTP